jgi:hypothetical protein
MLLAAVASSARLAIAGHAQRAHEQSREPSDYSENLINSATSLRHSTRTSDTISRDSGHRDHD